MRAFTILFVLTAILTPIPACGPGAPDARFGLWIDDMIADAGTAEEVGCPPGAGVEALLARGTSALMERRVAA